MVVPLLSIVRDVDKNYEIQIMVAYKYEFVNKLILNEVKNQLQKETDEVRKKYENILNPKNLNVEEVKNYSEEPATRQVNSETYCIGICEKHRVSSGATNNESAVDNWVKEHNKKCGSADKHCGAKEQIEALDVFY